MSDVLDGKLAHRLLLPWEIFTPSCFWVRSPNGTDRRTDGRTDREDPSCGLYYI